MLCFFSFCYLDIVDSPRTGWDPRIIRSSRWRSCWSNRFRTAMSSCHSSSQTAHHHPRLCHWEQPLLNGKKQFIIVSYSLFFLSFVCRLVDYIISSFQRIIELLSRQIVNFILFVLFSIFCALSRTTTKTFPFLNWYK